MASVLQRNLFWRIYLTLVASLVATALLGAGIWHMATHMPTPAVSAPGAATFTAPAVPAAPAPATVATAPWKRAAA